MDYLHHSRSSSSDSSPQFDFGYKPLFPIVASHSHSRHSSSLSSFTPDLNTPSDSPPSLSVKSHHVQRAPHFRSARIAASPYSRDTESVYSSSSEAEDLNLFYDGGSADYNLFGGGGGAAPPAVMSQHHEAFGRMTLGPDHALEQLATNVKVATTTSASDRAKQIFVQAWLTANYAPYPDGNVPRQGLYFSYRRVCDQYQIPHINTATLGKAIRLCFPSIKTRRLGVRGNSKYHYCGIRPATSAEAEFLQDYIRKANNAAALAQSQPRSNSQGGEDGSGEEDEEESESGSRSKRNSLSLAPPLDDGGRKSPTLYVAGMGMDISDKTPTTNSLVAQAQQRPTSSAYPPATIRRHNATGSPQGVSSTPSPVPAFTPNTTPNPMARGAVRNLPHFPSIEEALGSSESQHGAAAREVWSMFEHHLDTIIDNVRGQRYEQVELALTTFWRSLRPNLREIVHAPVVAGLMGRADAIVYDEILEILRSRIMTPVPPATSQALRVMATKMEKNLITALEDYGTTFVEPKVELGARFGHLVLRILDIYQVTQALQTVLSNAKQLSDMRNSWNNIDFESVRNQSALVCNCRHEDLVQLLEHDFRALLERLSSSQSPVQVVMAWADECCERLMANRATQLTEMDGRHFSSRSVLIRIGYVTSQVMRDLTIRSDPAFGAFQILKLFLDDWIALNVLRHVALSTNSVQASVEPVIQQQFFVTLSPMAGQESFPNIDSRGPPHMMGPNAQMATSQSMLAALHDPFVHDSNHLMSVGGDGSASSNPLAHLDQQHSEDGSANGFNPFADIPPYTPGTYEQFSGDHFTGADLGIPPPPTPDETAAAGLLHGSPHDQSQQTGKDSQVVKEEGV